MTATDSVISENGSSPEIKDLASPSFLSLNGVFRESIKKASVSTFIRFHTNTAATDNREAQHTVLLAEGRPIPAACGGHLAVNRITYTGCLFSISLPGKTQ